MSLTIAFVVLFLFILLIVNIVLTDFTGPYEQIAVSVPKLESSECEDKVQTNENEDIPSCNDNLLIKRGYVQNFEAPLKVNVDKIEVEEVTEFEVLSNMESSEPKSRWQHIKETIAKDAKKRKENWNKFKAWVSERNEKKKKKPPKKPARKIKRLNRPTLYKIQIAEMSFRNYNPFNIFQRPKRKFFKSYSYISSSDHLQDDWAQTLKEFSDYHPINYNGCIWMTTKTAKYRLKEREAYEKTFFVKPRRKIAYRNVQNFKTRKNFVDNPKVKSYYSIKKETCVRLNTTSIAQWRW